MERGFVEVYTGDYYTDVGRGCVVDDTNEIRLISKVLYERR